MKQYIDKSAIIAKIENERKHYLDKEEYDFGWNSALDKVLSIIKTLEVKEVELEKDSLTWEDIPELLSISEQLKTSWWFRDNTKEIGTQVFWEEVLKQFETQKGE